MRTQNSPTEHDDLLFSRDEQLLSRASNNEKGTSSCWKIMVVDDDELVHDVTHLVLSDLTFANRSIEIIDAYSAQEAIELLKVHSDVALVLLDVVMENDRAGLDVVRYIREKLHNHLVRIILRTGQPGNAPEEEIIQNYDINDYKEKTELTAKKLHTAVITSLRSYINLVTNIEQRSDKSRDPQQIIDSLRLLNKALQEEIEVRKKINDELIRSETALMLAQHVANIGHWAWCESENHYCYSEMLKQILGLPANHTSFDLNTLLRYVPESDIEHVRNTVEEAMRNKSNYAITHNLVNGKGEIKRVEHIGKFVIEENHQTPVFVATLRVIPN